VSDYCYQNYGISHINDYGSICLAGNLPGLNAYLVVAEFKRFGQLLHWSLPALKGVWAKKTELQQHQGAAGVKPCMMQELATQTESVDQIAIALQILVLQVIQQTPTLIHHAQQSAS